MKKIVLYCCVLMIVGCTSLSKDVTKYYMREDMRYLQSNEEHSLIIPAGLSRNNQQAIYPIPNVADPQAVNVSLLPPGSPSNAMEQKILQASKPTVKQNYSHH